MSGFDGWTIIAAVLFVTGVAVWIATRWRPGFAEHARALLVASVAIYLSGIAARTGDGYAIWFSGFFVCAALHRWIDAVFRNSNTTIRVKGAEQ